MYSLFVKVGKVVNKATPLAKIADISKAKLTIYLDKTDLIDIDKKTIYIKIKNSSLLTRLPRGLAALLPVFTPRMLLSVSPTSRVTSMPTWQAGPCMSRTRKTR